MLNLPDFISSLTFKNEPVVLNKSKIYSLYISKYEADTKNSES